MVKDKNNYLGLLGMIEGMMSEQIYLLYLMVINVFFMLVGIIINEPLAVVISFLNILIIPFIGILMNNYNPKTKKSSLSW